MATTIGELEARVKKLEEQVAQLFAYVGGDGQELKKIRAEIEELRKKGGTWQ
jgi:archaellum component FlaC